MNRVLLLIISVVMSSIVITACSQEKTADEWHPNVRLLDAMARSSPEGVGLAHDIKMFYQSLHDKQWHETYERRAKAFREDMLESDYLATVKKYEDAWGLINYQVLSVQIQDSDVAILICKFTELPDHTDTYSTVFWHKEEGGWKCLSAGPSKLGIFDATRPITIDWK